MHGKCKNRQICQKQLTKCVIRDIMIKLSDESELNKGNGADKRTLGGERIWKFSEKRLDKQKEVWYNIKVAVKRA